MNNLPIPNPVAVVVPSPDHSAAEFPPLEWFSYRQDVLNGRTLKSEPLIESELYYKSLDPIEQQNFDRKARAFFADNLDFRNKSTIFLRDRYYWEVKE